MRQCYCAPGGNVWKRQWQHLINEVWSDVDDNLCKWWPVGVTDAYLFGDTHANPTEASCMNECFHNIQAWCYIKRHPKNKNHPQHKLSVMQFWYIYIPALQKKPDWKHIPLLHRTLCVFVDVQLGRSATSCCCPVWQLIGRRVHTAVTMYLSQIHWEKEHKRKRDGPQLGAIQDLRNTTDCRTKRLIVWQ